MAYNKCSLIRCHQNQILGCHIATTPAACWKRSGLTCGDSGKALTGPDWALGMAKHSGTHSAAQQTTATFPHLICKAIPLPSHSGHSVHLFVISTARLHWLCPLRRQVVRREEKHMSQGDCSASKEHLHMKPSPLKKKTTHTHAIYWANTHSPISPPD